MVHAIVEDSLIFIAAGRERVLGGRLPHLWAALVTVVLGAVVTAAVRRWGPGRPTAVDRREGRPIMLTKSIDFVT